MISVHPMWNMHRVKANKSHVSTNELFKTHGLGNTHKINQICHQPGHSKLEYFLSRFIIVLVVMIRKRDASV